MPTRHSFDYAVIRVVPNVERAEFLNAGVVLHCPERAFLGCRMRVDDPRISALWPNLDAATVREHLQSFERICGGEADAGPIAQLSRRERFHWITAPRSTIIQVSPVHTGLTDDPAATLEDLFRRLA